MLKLNFGCGTGKLKGYINIDIDPKHKPDVCLDMTQLLPYASGHVSEIACLHTIEHVHERYFNQILAEFNRILCARGELIFAYPEASECMKGWLNNTGGQREFYAATIFGRGLSQWDNHRTLMDSRTFVPLLKEFGFSVRQHSEPDQKFNTVLLCRKVFKTNTKEDLIKKELLQCKTV